MPTIELVSLGAEAVPALPAFSTFACRAEHEPRSHRALFQPVFDRVRGIMVHLGDKELEAGLESGGAGAWVAGGLIAWDGRVIEIPAVDPALGAGQGWGEDQAHSFRFLPRVLAELEQLVGILQRHSPTGEVYFSTDYQFGPAEPAYRSHYTTARLLAEHAASGLRWNCLYHLVPTEERPGAT